MAGEHINLLELRAIFTGIKWKVSRSKMKLGVRFLHLTDSLVCLHALTRGRSSSRKLRPILMRLNALLLAADLHPFGVTYILPRIRPTGLAGGLCVADGESR